MPWRVTEVMNERIRFVVRLESGEKMTDLCKEYGISRKTGYKFWNRYREKGPEGLGDYSRRTHRHPNRTPGEIEALVVSLRQEHPTWGPKKIKARLHKLHPGVAIPAASTIGELLKRCNLVRPRRKRRRATPTHPEDLTQPIAANEVWCADFKGQFRLKNGQYCYPLTITDQHTRYLIGCEAQENTKTEGAYATFVEAFDKYGLPMVIRTDNGTPFASTGLAGLSRLSVWWMRLGIKPERIEPGHPEQNGRHERMHLTLKQDATRPPGANLLQQQEKLDRFREIFNEVRPHEALSMQSPGDFYEASQRPYPGLLDDLEYPLHDRTCKVKSCGRIYVGRGLTPYIGSALAGETLGLREIRTERWLVSFMDRDLGVYSSSGKVFEPYVEGTPLKL